MSRKTEGIDNVLSVLENPIRRRILDKLVHETHYPLQLSKELGVSQQAIMKHLNAMEEKGIVRSYEVPSTAGGPARKCYVPTISVTLRIDMTPSTFNIEMKELPRDEPKMSDKAASSDFVTQIEEYRALPKDRRADRVKALSQMVAGIDREIRELEYKRTQLLNIRRMAVNEANHVISELDGDYRKRQVLYVLVEGKVHSMDELSEYLDIRTKVLREMMSELEEFMSLVDEKRA